jgi:cellulose synthase/poly-beta-1,6-N-acetylglucosamine synthase-like glycosyltransferase
MSNAAELVLWTALAIVAYCYAIYPPLIWACSRLFGRGRAAPQVAEQDLPTVTLLIAAHNEESWIQDRIENALQMDYPADKLEILVASDGSSDATARLVGDFFSRGVRLLEYSVNHGKAITLNASIPQASHSIVVFSDANTSFDGGAIRNLVRWFTDPGVGTVCGRLVLTDPRKGKNIDSLYWKYETFLKKCESRLGALLGANGAIYALRQSDYVPIPPDTLVDDFMIPLVARLRDNKAIIYDHDAVAWEECPPELEDEFRRRARIGAGGFQAMVRLLPLLSPAQGWVSFSFLSHKILRWLCPFFLILALAANAVLLESRFYLVLMFGQLGFYLVSALGGVLPGRGLTGRLLRLPAMFTSMNLALLVGFWNWICRPQRGTWQRTARCPAADSACNR